MNRPSLDVDGLQELLWSFAGHRVLTVAARLGILQALAAQAATAQEVAAQCGLDPLATGKIVRALTALGLLVPDPAGYRVAEEFSPYFQPGDEDITPFLEHSHAMYERWGENLEQWVQGGVWPTQKRGAGDTRRFGAAMRAMGMRLARQVIQVLDLGGVHKMLDLGGGFGHYAQVFCQERPDLRAVVLDTPEVVEAAREELAQSPLAQQITFCDGDYLETDCGADFDLVLIANVLHQESAPRAAALVRRGAAALAPQGRLAVVDFSIDDAQQASVVGALFAINMRSFGDTYSEPTIRYWMKEAGLAAVERFDLSGHRWAIVGRKTR
jgi:SAM-dependent methyltransferase